MLNATIKALAPKEVGNTTRAMGIQIVAGIGPINLTKGASQ